MGAGSEAGRTKQAWETGTTPGIRAAPEPFIARFYQQFIQHLSEQNLGQMLLLAALSTGRRQVLSVVMIHQGARPHSSPAERADVPIFRHHACLPLLSKRLERLSLAAAADHRLQNWEMLGERAGAGTRCCHRRRHRLGESLCLLSGQRPARRVAQWCGPAWRWLSICISRWRRL